MHKARTTNRTTNTTPPRSYPRERHPSTIDTVEPAVLTEAEAARYIGRCRSLLRHSRIEGTGPVYLRFGRNIRYRRIDLDAYLEAHAVRANA